MARCTGGIIFLSLVAHAACAARQLHSACPWQHSSGLPAFRHCKLRCCKTSCTSALGCSVSKVSQHPGCLQLLGTLISSQPALQAMGADEAVDYNVEKFDDKFQDDKFDVVVDTIGGKLCTRWGIAHAVCLLLPMLTGTLCITT